MRGEGFCGSEEGRGRGGMEMAARVSKVEVGGAAAAQEGTRVRGEGEGGRRGAERELAGWDAERGRGAGRRGRKRREREEKRRRRRRRRWGARRLREAEEERLALRFRGEGAAPGSVKERGGEGGEGLAVLCGDERGGMEEVEGGGRVELKG